ncbi:MAG: efflux RND transporter periplasmic adaptor subunit [Deltaproteobacteria bacterium]|nr:efflux RND transporter periplasmic adaptor subunit [Deltaproteobacteria bacterium]
MAAGRKKHRTWWIAVPVILAGIAGALYWRYGRAEAQPTRYVTQAVGRTRIIATVTASGTVSPLKTVQVGSQVSGRVLELNADFNDHVKKGQVVARIDPQLFMGEITKARANLLSARSSVLKAQATLDDAKQADARARTLAAKGLVAQVDADTAAVSLRSATASKTAAEASVSQARAVLQQAEINLAYTTIASPIDGVVISRNVDVGQTVAASLSAPTLFTIAEDMRAMEIHTSVAESDVGVLRDGMDVEFTVDAFPGERFKGKVTQIRNSPVTVQNVVTYDAVIRVDNGELKLRPGMTANVTFIVADHADVVAVPSTALRFAPPNAQKLLEEARAKRTGASASASPGPSTSPSTSTSTSTSTNTGTNTGTVAEGEGGRRGPRGNGGGAAPAGGWKGRSQSSRTVWILVNDQPQPVRVEIGLTDGSMTEIVTGPLPEGALVITGSNGAKPATAPVQQQRGGGRTGRPPGGLGL